MPGNVLYPVSPYPNIRPNANPFPGGGDDGGGIGNLLQAMHPVNINQAQVNTGTDTQGNPTFDISPASIQGGFMDRLLAGKQGRSQVNQINANLQQAKLEALARLAEQRQAGSEARKTHITDAQITMLQGLGLMPKTTPSGDAIDADLVNKVASQTEQPGLDAAGAKAKAGNVVAQNNLQTLQSPQGQKALTDSSIGQAIMPALAAQKASGVQASPGETVAYQGFGDLMNSQPDILHGASSSSQSFTPVMNPNYGRKGHESEPLYSPMTSGISQVGQGSLSQPIDSSIIQQAAQQQNPPQAQVSTGVDPTLGMQFAQQPTASQPSNIPNQPSPTPGSPAAMAAQQNNMPLVDPNNMLFQMLRSMMQGQGNGQIPQPQTSFGGF